MASLFWNDALVSETTLPIVVPGHPPIYVPAPGWVEDYFANLAGMAEVDFDFAFDDEGLEIQPQPILPPQSVSALLTPPSSPDVVPALLPSVLPFDGDDGKGEPLANLFEWISNARMGGEGEVTEERNDAPEWVRESGISTTGGGSRLLVEIERLPSSDLTKHVARWTNRVIPKAPLSEDQFTRIYAAHPTIFTAQPFKMTFLDEVGNKHELVQTGAFEPSQVRFSHSTTRELLDTAASVLRISEPFAVRGWKWSTADELWAHFPRPAWAKRLPAGMKIHAWTKPRDGLPDEVGMLFLDVPSADLPPRSFEDFTHPQEYADGVRSSSQLDAGESLWAAPYDLCRLFETSHFAVRSGSSICVGGFAGLVGYASIPINKVEVLAFWMRNGMRTCVDAMPFPSVIEDVEEEVDERAGILGDLLDNPEFKALGRRERSLFKRVRLAQMASNTEKELSGPPYVGVVSRVVVGPKDGLWECVRLDWVGTGKKRKDQDLEEEEDVNSSPKKRRTSGTDVSPATASATLVNVEEVSVQGHKRRRSGRLSIPPQRFIGGAVD